MLKTEEEARKLWCAHSRIGRYEGDSSLGIGGAAVNRFWSELKRWFGWDLEIEELEECSTNCIASQCMAWRWERVRQIVPAKDPRAEQGVRFVDGERGFCGLAGKPDQ